MVHRGMYNINYCIQIASHFSRITFDGMPSPPKFTTLALVTKHLIFNKLFLTLLSEKFYSLCGNSENSISKNYYGFQAWVDASCYNMQNDGSNAIDAMQEGGINGWRLYFEVAATKSCNCVPYQNVGLLKWSLWAICKPGLELVTPSWL